MPPRPYSLYPYTRAKSTVRRTKKLVYIIQDYPALYDPTHPDYTNTTATDAIWQKIAKDFDRNPSWIKSKFSTLKSSFIKEQCRPILVQMGAATPRRGKWRYQGVMDYFHPYWKEEEMHLIRWSQSQMNAAQPNEENQTDMTFHDTLFEYYKDQEGGNCKDEPIELVPIGEQQIDSIPSPPSYQKDVEFDVPSKKDQDSKDWKPKEKSQSDGGTLYHFFMSMYNSTNVLPTMLQLRVKRQIFTALAEIEEKMCEL